MSKSPAKRFSANEKEINQLLQENSAWSKQLYYAAEEIQFFNRLLTSDVFEGSQLNLIEKLQSFSHRLDNVRSKNMDLTLEVHKHRYDLEGMRECEDISCDTFYHSEHLNLEKEIDTFLKEFQEVKLEVIRYTGTILRKNS